MNDEPQARRHGGGEDDGEQAVETFISVLKSFCFKAVVIGISLVLCMLSVFLSFY